MGFLGDLAGMALGTPPAGAARIAHPPRFAPRLAPLDPPDAAPNAAASAPVEQPDAAQHGPILAQADAAPASTGTGAITQDVARRPSPDAREAIGRQALGIEVAKDAIPTPTPRLAAAPSAIEPAIGGPAVPPLRREPTPLPPGPAKGSFVAASVAAPLAPERAAASRAAPLSETARAARSSPTVPPAPTIVRVTIDRIDVRAPAATPAPAAPRRPRPEPTVSLADYLARRDQRA